ncbi:uncharacterized protein LOC135831265 [Planococcus citri]|uniref:uncharacterized protein LOC135831265 n=1 Tax=Planococcus citri TaxID=170843 RepID=UPI0031F96EBC
MSNDYSSLKVVDLKKELKTRGLSTAGNKDELVERLHTYTQNLLGSGSDIDGFSESIAENDILDEDVLNEELDYEEDVLKKSSELVFSGSGGNTSLDLPADVSVDSNNSSLNVTVVAANEEKPLPQREQNNQKGEKKVHLIRNRSLSLISNTDLKENDKSDENNKSENDDDNKKDESSIKLCTKIIPDSLEERLELRKRKFGVLREEDKKKARAARFGITTEPTTNTKQSAASKPLTESVDILKNRAQRFGLTTAPALDKTKMLETLKTRAERFGKVVSPLLNKLSEEEKMQARKNRFLTTGNNDLSTEEKKKLRAQRFNIAT